MKANVQTYDGSSLMRGHGPGALCEICNTRPGVRLVTMTGCQAWVCLPCGGIDPADYGEDEQP